MRVLAIVLALAVTAACGGATGAPAGPQAGKDVRKAAQKRAREMAQEVYRSLRRGKVDELTPLLAADAFLVGAGARDVYRVRADALVALSAAFGYGKKHKLTSHDLRAGASPSGTAAWVADRVDIDGVTYRVSAVLIDDDGLWTIVAVHVARAIGGERVDELRKGGKLAALAPLPGGVAGGAGEARELLRAGLASPQAFLDQLDGSKEAVVAGSGPRDAARGAKAIKKMWKRLLADPPAASERDAVAGLVPDGSLAWACANVDVAAGGGTIPQRFFAVYEHEGRAWRLVSLHAAVAP